MTDIWFPPYVAAARDDVTDNPNVFENRLFYRALRTAQDGHVDSSDFERLREAGYSARYQPRPDGSVAWYFRAPRTEGYRRISYAQMVEAVLGAIPLGTQRSSSYDNRRAQARAERYSVITQRAARRAAVPLGRRQSQSIGSHRRIPRYDRENAHIVRFGDEGSD